MTVRELVDRYQEQRVSCLKTAYNETQLRNDFIDPLLKCLGWDVDNNQGKTQALRDVIQEEYIEVEDEVSKKNPDYTLRINGTRKLFVEVKKPSVNILKSAKSAFQTRRYGWNANLGISVLTNFEHLVIYDCRYKPNISENEQVALVRVFNFTEYVDQFDEILKLISFDSANSGKLDEQFSLYERKGETFDDYFLEQIEKWRYKLAVTAVEKNESLDDEDLNFLIQRLLNRIIFLRICEDRTIEKFETLKNVKSYDELKVLFQQSDKKFNSGLFDFIEDTLSLKIEIDSEVLIGIFNELYFPLSPYDFSVVDPTILSQIYEKFLGSRIVMGEGRQLSLAEEPEVAASNGVVPTPKLIVEQIIRDTLSPLISDKSVKELQDLKIADICCGSGTFLISGFDFLQQALLEKLIEEDPQNKELIYKPNDSTFALTLRAKRNILEQNLFGVDVNPYATEVSEFSLLLKLLEGETKATVDSFLSQYTDKVLPNLKTNIKCGNSLVDSRFFEFMPEALENDGILMKVNPFNWESEFPFLEKRKGFDAIIGNPPYVRIQNLVKYAPEEVKFYQSTFSGYSVAKKETIDKYYVFIQRALGLLNARGVLGYIVPHKFFLLKGGKALREFISSASYISKIIHFGVTQVFPGRSTYTALLILQKEPKTSFRFRRIKKITPELLDRQESYVSYENNDFAAEPWIFLSPETAEIFKKLRSGGSVPLKDLAEICVGLQTSADKIYIFEPEAETEATYKFTKNEKQWEVEKGICQPAIYDLTFNLFDTIAANARMIFPYTITDSGAELYSEKHLKSNFPLALAYLQHHKTKLEKRNLQGKSPSWYQFGRSQSLTKFQNTPKLVWSVLANRPPYALDEGNLQFTGGGNGPYYALVNGSEYSLLYFLAILSHPLFEYMVKAGASEFRGAYYSHGKQFIENIPIRKIDFNDQEESAAYTTIVKLVDSLIKTKVQLRNAPYGSKKTVYQRKKDELNDRLVQSINLLYGISEEEYDSVMNDEMFTTELAIEE